MVQAATNRARNNIDMSEDLSEPSKEIRSAQSVGFYRYFLFAVRRMVSQPHLPLPVIGANVVDEHIRDEAGEYDREHEIDNVNA
ncbi:MAG: hypothetical protein BGO25_09135 [Acidobacteriales bacterium 59-55]|nr:MAG: hypothetical protein BGO25_09135 [Acidobacteriales bacterium 59-55]